MVMRVPKQESKPQIVLDVHQYPLSAAEEEILRTELQSLEAQVASFPVADFHLRIEGNSRNNDVTVKLTLLLSGASITVGDADVVLHAAFERSLNQMRDRIRDHKERL